jgi:hypothetical protein
VSVSSPASMSPSSSLRLVTVYAAELTNSSTAGTGTRTAATGKPGCCVLHFTGLQTIVLRAQLIGRVTQVNEAASPLLPQTKTQPSLLTV